MKNKPYVKESNYRLQVHDAKGKWRIQQKEYDDRPCGDFSWRTIQEFNNPDIAAKELEKLRDAENPDAGWETIG